MNAPPRPIKAISGAGLAGALVAGIHHLVGQREAVNRINVFPVPDGDTGSNLAFTFKAVLDAIASLRSRRLDGVLAAVAAAALDGARGNSGAIMAQFLEGCRERAGRARRLDTARLADCCRHGARLAWGAMAEPVPGTLPTVLEDFAAALQRAHADGVRDLREQFRRALAAARASLAGTPDLLPVLKQAGVVDAGGQGFVDLLEGIGAWLEAGVLEPLDAEAQAQLSAPPEEAVDWAATAGSRHRWCTECVIGGEGLDRGRILQRLKGLDQSSLVVAGGAQRVRVHVHVDQPGEVFLACAEFGELLQQKADDMHRQHGLLGQPGRVAVVTDSGADLPPGEVERLGIHVVPVRLSFGDREYLDGVSLTPAEFYRLLETSGEAPRTSQPPPGDFRRLYEWLVSHGYPVVSVGLSTALSGTTQAAMAAARRVGGGRVQVVDSRNASCGQGLLAIVAAEAAAAGLPSERIVAMLERLLPQVQTLAIPDELGPAVRGGRVPAWAGTLARWLRVTPVLAARDGRLVLAGLRPGRGADPQALAQRLLARLDPATSYRFMVAHADHREGAEAVRRLLLEGHPLVHSCHIAEAGPALGVHLGRHGLIVGALPQPAELAGAGA